MTTDVLEVGEGLIYHVPLQTLICKLHGQAVHGNVTAVKRHLRGPDHKSRGQTLAQVLSKISKLQISGVTDIYDLYQDGQLAGIAIPYLKIHDGWCCLTCDEEEDSEDFLTTSLEIMKRHAGSLHARLRAGKTMWKAVKMQTIFAETKDRRYFCINAGDTEMTDTCDRGLVRSIMISSREFLAASKRVQHTRQDTRLKSFRKPFKSSPNQLPLAVMKRDELPPGMLIDLKHPFAEVVERYVPLTSNRINFLLKSGAFRSAAMPIFDANFTQSALHMTNVFPESEESPVWATALLYSTVQILNRGKITTEGEFLQARTIRLLNMKLESLEQTLCSAAIGAIMVLKATAYKTGDSGSLKVHTAGLEQMLEYMSKTNVKLSKSARKALFWLDIGAAAYVDHPYANPALAVTELPHINWRRESLPGEIASPSSGFLRHQDILSCVLLECATDLRELQERNAHLSDEDKGSMQASLEVRLLLYARDVPQRISIEELIRLALYICTYCTWTGTWNVKMLPCRLARRMIDIINEQMLQQDPVFDDLVHYRCDLYFWLLHTCSSAVDLDEGYVENIRGARDTLLRTAAAKLISHGTSEYNGYKRALEQALNDFVCLEVSGGTTSWDRFQNHIQQ